MQYTLDHLVPWEIGGADVVKNMWPEPRRSLAGEWDDIRKDQLERRLKVLLCGGELDVILAQREIAEIGPRPGSAMRARSNRAAKPMRLLRPLLDSTRQLHHVFCRNSQSRGDRRTGQAGLAQALDRGSVMRDFGLSHRRPIPSFRRSAMLLMKYLPRSRKSATFCSSAASSPPDPRAKCSSFCADTLATNAKAAICRGLPAANISLSGSELRRGRWELCIVTPSQAAGAAQVRGAALRSGNVRNATDLLTGLNVLDLEVAAVGDDTDRLDVQNLAGRVGR